MNHSNINKLKQVFPTVVKDGQVDWECLADLLGTSFYNKEKYELTWAGKQEAKRCAQESLDGYTLKLCPEKSVDLENTQNLYIEGENRNVLKLLRKNYFGAIKMIYIDPPYNTGNDFIYRDNYTVSQAEADLWEGNVDENGNRYVVNQKTSNRFHARWLNELYPLLRLARDFLTKDGSIFISIDDNEVTNLRLICNEIFGEENFVACVIWNRKRGRDNSARWFSKSHEYLLVYAKNKNAFHTNYLELDEETKKAYKNPDSDPRGPYRMLATWARGTQGGVEYDYTTKDGTYFSNRLWLFSKENLKKLEEEGKLVIRGDHIYRKLFLSENKGKIPETIWNHTSNAANASDEMKRLFGEIVFDTSKPTPYIQEMIKIATGPNDIIMDFFSGSASTANAVMQQNREDGGKRKFIMVQIPEICPPKSAAYRQGFGTICDIGRERIIREGRKMKEDAECAVDVGFKTLTIAETNIRWNYPKQAAAWLNNYKEQNTDELDFMPGTKWIDVAYEIILKQNDILLSEKMNQREDLGRQTFLYGESYLICLEKKVDRKLLEKIASLDPFPIKIFFRDSAFQDDLVLKDEVIRRLQILTEKNSEDRKNTYTVEFI